MRLHAKDDPENTMRIVKELQAALEHFNEGKDLDHIELRPKDSTKLLIENKEFCELFSPFNIDQPHTKVVS